MSGSASEMEGLLPPGGDAVPVQQLPAQPTSYAIGYQSLTANQSSSANTTTVVMAQPSAGGQCSTTYEIQHPPNRLVLAYVALCLCTWCCPALVFAIVGIIYSIQVDSRWTNKDYAGAQKASFYAKRWSIAALIVGGVGVFTLLPAYIYLIVLAITVYYKGY